MPLTHWFRTVLFSSAFGLQRKFLSVAFLAGVSTLPACSSDAEPSPGDEVTRSNAEAVNGAKGQARIAFDFAHAGWSSDAPFLPEYLGGPGWLPFYGDVDGDGLSDRVLFDPGTAKWWASTSSGRLPAGWPSNPHAFGVGSWQTMMAEIDGDGILDRVGIDGTSKWTRRHRPASRCRQAGLRTPCSSEGRAPAGGTCSPT